MRVLIFLITLFIPLSRLVAEEDARCEWTDCAKPKSAPTSSVPELPTCEKSDQLSCKDECRNHFGTDFHDCVEKCLGGRCVTPKPRSTSPSREEEDKQGCLELETEECASECKLKGDAASAKCRRGCLEQRCPDSNRLDLAKESADPGALRCERCRVEAKDFCASSCGVGLIAGELGRSTGLENLGCVKVCVVATCQKSCGMSF